jgi:hypothetical protein
VAPVRQSVSPSGGDDTAAIQGAIDAVSALPVQGGLRGAVLLAPGTFNVSATLAVAASGVVLRGSGSGSGGTLLNATGPPRYALTVLGTGSWARASDSPAVTDAYVPSGSRTFHVDKVDGLAVGTPILVGRPVTSAWVHFMGMDALVRDGHPQTWLALGTVIESDRVITAVDGSAITVDAPLSDALDAAFVSPPGVRVAPYTFAGRISEVGIEAIRVVVPKQSVPIRQPTYDLLHMDAVENAWVRDVVAEEVTEGFVLGATSKRVTVEDSAILRTAPVDKTDGYPFEYSIDGQQILVQRCSAQASSLFSFATKSRAPGPNVVLRFTVKGGPGQLQPHERWSTGLLVDGAEMPDADIDFMNRGIYGSGHGWTMGFGVVWNSVAHSLLIEQPPGSQNWAIGTSGTWARGVAPGATTLEAPGAVDSPGAPVSPESLYLAQLCERLGPGAVGAIGY